MREKVYGEFEIKYLMNAKIELEHRIIQLEELKSTRYDKNHFLDLWIKYFDKRYHERIEKLEEQIKSLTEMYKHISSIVAGCQDHKIRQIDENRKVSQRLDELGEQDRLLLSLINEVKGWLTTSDLLKRIEKEKKTGLSFEEAITAFKNGKCIRREAHGVVYRPSYNKGYGFDYSDMHKNDWEIVN